MPPSALLKEQNIKLKINDKAIKYIAEKGYSDEYGARPLRRLIQRELDNVVSQMIIKGDLLEGDSVTVVSEKSGLEVKFDGQGKLRMIA